MLRQQAFAQLAAKRAQNSAHVGSLIFADSYDRRGIMRAAIESARARRQVTGEAWGTCLSAALRGTWQTAKAAMAAAKLREELQAGRARQLTDFVRVPVGSVSSEMCRVVSNFPKRPSPFSASINAVPNLTTTP